MSGRVVYTPPEGKHHCHWIAPKPWVVGTIAQCDCGRLFEYTGGALMHWHPRSMRWLKRHHRELWDSMQQP